MTEEIPVYSRVEGMESVTWVKAPDIERVVQEVLAGGGAHQDAYKAGYERARFDAGLCTRPYDEDAGERPPGEFFDAPSPDLPGSEPAQSKDGGCSECDDGPCDADSVCQTYEDGYNAGQTIADWQKDELVKAVRELVEGIRIAQKCDLSSHAQHIYQPLAKVKSLLPAEGGGSEPVGDSSWMDFPWDLALEDRAAYFRGFTDSEEGAEVLDNEFREAAERVVRVAKPRQALGGPNMYEQMRVVRGAIADLEKTLKGLKLPDEHTV